MFTITTEQARNRFTTLPPTLQDAVFSEQTAEIIASTIEKFHLSEERAEEIPTLVGWVLLGFLHIEDLPDEIAASAGIPKPLAKEISDSLSNKIFEPLRSALAQFHAPVPEPMSNAPVRINIEGMTAEPKIIGGTTFTATPGNQRNVVVGPRIAAAAKPATSDQQPATSNQVLPSSIGKPIPHFDQKPNLGGALATQAAPAVKQEAKGEFARLAAEKPGAGGQGPGTTTSSPVKPLTPVQPNVNKPLTGTGNNSTTSNQLPATRDQQPGTGAKPVMLQTNPESKPIQNAPNLTNTQKAIDILGAKKLTVPMPVRPAVVEFEKAPQTVAENQQPTGQHPAALSSQPGADNSSREVTELTAMPQAARPEQPIVKHLESAISIEPGAGSRELGAGTPKPTGLAPIKLSVEPQAQPQIQPQQPKPQVSTQPAPPMPKAPLPGAEKVIVKNFKEGEG